MPLVYELDPRRLTEKERRLAVIFFFGYFAASQAAVVFFTAPAVLTPAPGVALAGLVLGGIGLWPAIFLGALMSAIVSGASLPLLLVLPFAHTLQAIVGTLILKTLGFDPVLRRLRDTAILMGVAFTVSAVVPIFGYLALTLARQAEASPVVITWGSWWTGHILSLLIVAPLLIRWLAKPAWYRTTSQVFEIIAAFSALGVVSSVLYIIDITNIENISVVYALLLPLFWIAIRMGSRLTTLAIFITALFAFGGTLYDPNPASTLDLGTQIFQLQVFIIILAVIFYIVSGLQEERVAAIKDLKSYIAQLERALNQLSLQDRAKTDFVAVLAHELRNPLAPVVSTLELLRLNLAPQGKEELRALEQMDNHLKTIERLLDDLLDVSRISKSKLRLKKEVVALGNIVESSIQSIERYLKIREQTLILDLEEEPIMLEADPVRVEQIFNNLLSNASKFTPKGGKISLSTRKENDWAVVRVKDTGIGIDPPMLERIFEPFTQLEDGTRPQEGLGIGLALTKELVEMHAGEIRAHSDGKGMGSEFVVRLPILATFESTPVRKEETKAPLPHTSSPKMKILVVDDNEAAAKGISTLLEHKGYVVLCAYSGSEAIEQAKGWQPDVVVLDIGLPDIDGYQVARQLRREHNFQGRIIALTGYGQDEDKERAQATGFDHHLTKPIAIADLEKVLHAS